MNETSKSRMTDRSKQRYNNRQFEKRTKNPIMPFGEHKGTPLTELPTTYLEHVIKTTKDSPLISKIVNVLLARDYKKPTKYVKYKRPKKLHK